MNTYKYKNFSVKINTLESKALSQSTENMLRRELSELDERFNSVVAERNSLFTEACDRILSEDQKDKTEIVGFDWF